MLEYKQHQHEYTLNKALTTMIHVINLKNITKSPPPTYPQKKTRKNNTNKQSNKTNKHKRAKKKKKNTNK